jgi:hypothetical protein
LSDDRTWRPWVDYAPSDPKEIAAELPVYSPPCGMGCRYWAPRRKYKLGEFKGIICCHSPMMEADFSCFTPKGTVEEKSEETPTVYDGGPRPSPDHFRKFDPVTRSWYWVTEP